MAQQKKHENKQFLPSIDSARTKEKDHESIDNLVEQYHRRVAGALVAKHRTITPGINEVSTVGDQNIAGQKRMAFDALDKGNSTAFGTERETAQKGMKIAEPTVGNDEEDEALKSKKASPKYQRGSVESKQIRTNDADLEIDNLGKTYGRVAIRQDSKRKRSDSADDHAPTSRKATAKERAQMETTIPSANSEHGQAVEESRTQATKIAVQIPMMKNTNTAKVVIDGVDKRRENSKASGEGKRVTWLVKYNLEGPGAILFYKSSEHEGGPFGFLSTFTQREVVVPEIGTFDFNSVEHVYQFIRSRWMACATSHKMSSRPGRKIASGQLHVAVALASSPALAIHFGRAFDDYETSDNFWWQCWYKPFEYYKWLYLHIAVRSQFNAHHDMAILLLMTGDFKIFHAHPHDKDTGIGFHAADALCHKEDWGRNHLGAVLERVRTDLRSLDRYKKLPTVYHFYYWRLWEETCNEERDRQIERKIQGIEVGEEMMAKDRMWRKKRDEQLAALRKNFEVYQTDPNDDLSDPAIYENLVEQLGKLPFHLALDLEPPRQFHQRGSQ